MNGDSVWVALDRAHGDLPFPGDGRETRALITWANKAMHAFAKIRHDTKHLYRHTAELRARVLELEERLAPAEAKAKAKAEGSLFENGETVQSILTGQTYKLDLRLSDYPSVETLRLTAARDITLDQAIVAVSKLVDFVKDPANFNVNIGLGDEVQRLRRAIPVVTDGRYNAAEALRQLDDYEGDDGA